MSDDTLADRLDAIQNQVNAACKRAGRDPAEVRLVTVSKKQTPDTIREAADAGLSVFGENKVQEAAAKIPLCPDGLTWHLIGHLQSNKARLAVALFDMIHSVDSLKLLQRIDQLASECGRTLAVCLQVNVSGEASKSGLPPEAVPEVLAGATRCINVDLVGLMTIPPFTPDPADATPHFRRLRVLRDQWQEEHGIPLPELSMGMSHDFEYAIAEGATWIRIGTALLGKRG
jgi:pyridoxal phosphate enzyme (YggS family)